MSIIGQQLTHHNFTSSTYLYQYAGMAGMVGMAGIAGRSGIFGMLLSSHVEVYVGLFDVFVTARRTSKSPM